LLFLPLFLLANNLSKPSVQEKNLHAVVDAQDVAVVLPVRHQRIPSSKKEALQTKKT